MKPGFLLLVLGALIVASVSVHADEEREVSFSLPPASLGQWYKPANKRQVWLHTMFGLRREMLAVSDYLALEDSEHLQKWVNRLAQHYRKIGEMVPEWREELDLEQLERLQAAAEQGDYPKAADAQRKLGHSCNSCHREYRAAAAAIYRSPDFSGIRIEDSETLEEEPYKRVMQRLSLLLNRVKIASEDGRKQTAIDSLNDLTQRLDDLGQSCESCHRGEAPRSRVLGKEMSDTLMLLERSVEAGDAKDTGRNMGTLAVQTCARCHGVHRTLYDLRRELVPTAPASQ